MRALLKAFSDAGIDYALCGGIAANVYGADRFTKDIEGRTLTPMRRGARCHRRTYSYGWWLEIS